MPSPATTYILRHIYSNIPQQILEEAFNPGMASANLDERILSLSIYPRVLLDTNLVATRMTQILLLPEWTKNTFDGFFDTFASMTYNSVFLWIPPEARENRNIASVVRVLDATQQMSPTTDGALGGYTNYGNTVSAMSDAMVASRTLNGAAYLPRVTLEGNNFIKIYGNYPNSYIGGLTLECTLEYDTEFNNADTNMIYHLRELSLCAVKAYIYNTLIIKIDQAMVSAGMEIGVFKDIVQSYANANDEYHSKLMNVRGAQIMDANTLSEFIWMQL